MYAIAKRVPYAAHVIVLFTFAFSAFVLVILCTFSSPFIRSINFLSIPSGGDATAIRTTFGAFGWCAPDFCLPSAIGYEYGTQVNKALTSAMILWAISIIFLFFTTISILPLLFVHQSRALRYIGNSQFFLFCSWLSMLLVSLAWVMSIYGWSIAHRAFDLGGTDANLGPAIWLGLTAAILSVMLASKCLGWRADRGGRWGWSERSARGWILSPQANSEGGNPEVLALLEIARSSA